MEFGSKWQAEEAVRLSVGLMIANRPVSVFPSDERKQEQDTFKELTSRSSGCRLLQVPHLEHKSLCLCCRNALERRLCDVHRKPLVRRRRDSAARVLSEGEQNPTSVRLGDEATPRVSHDTMD